jgi:putative tryptophan/tyrosine transport system substrate-binding protein
MKRREFTTLLGGAAVGPSMLWPLTARAQQPDRVRRIGFWVGEVDSAIAQRRVAAFQQGLRELGWLEGRNIHIECRWEILGADRIRSDAADLVALNLEVIVTTGAPSLAALLQITRSIPIVFTFVTDPVKDGFVASLSHPGGNVTGFTIFEHTIAGKWLEMLKEAAPNVTRVAVMQNPEHPAWTAYLNAIGTVAPAVGVQVTPAPVHDAADIERAIDAFAREPNGGLIVLPSGIAVNYRELITGTTQRYRLPSIYPERSFTESGGLISYGVVLSDTYRQTATYVDLILKGTKPSELPVQASTKFELLINLKTAKTLGIEVPPTLLVRADEVIE